MAKETKRLYQSRDNKVIAGVAGGLGEYLNVDPTLMRVIFVVVIILTGVFPGLIVYLVMALVMPKRDVSKKIDEDED